MARPLKQLAEVLKARRWTQRQLDKLDALLADGTITQGHYDATASDYRSRLKAVNNALEDVRGSIRPRLREARKEEGEAGTKLAALEAKHEQGLVTDDKYAHDVDKLRARLGKAEAQRVELERALVAESPVDLLPPGSPEPEEEDDLEMLRKGPASEFPGVSVPERLFMLFRETRNPAARGPIKVSALVVAVLIAVVFGTVAISGALADNGLSTGPVGKGEIIVPVVGENLSGVGSVSIAVDYDPQVLTAVEVVPGVLARARTVTSDVLAEGTVSAEVDATYGLDESGDLVLLVFRINQLVSDNVELRVTAASAVGLEDGSELQVETEDGWANTWTLDSSSPVLRVS